MGMNISHYAFNKVGSCVLEQRLLLQDDDFTLANDWFCRSFLNNYNIGGHFLTNMTLD